MAAAVLLAIRSARVDRGSCGHHLPVGLHDLDEPARMEGRRAADLCWTCQLHPPAGRCAFRRVGVAHAGLHRAVGRAAVIVRHARGGGVSRQISDARLSARPLHPADDGNPGRDRAGVDDDVPPATRYPQLPAVARRPAAAALGVHPATVIPSLVLVETWQWTPLVMPFLFIASMIRMIDAVKSFDIIFAITQGGPGSASETINLYLYSVAFIYYDLGYGSAIAVVFFILIVMLAAVLLYLRQRTLWTEIGGGA